MYLESGYFLLSPLLQLLSAVFLLLSPLHLPPQSLGPPCCSVNTPSSGPALLFLDIRKAHPITPPLLRSLPKCSLPLRISLAP